MQTWAFEQVLTESVDQDSLAKDSPHAEDEDVAMTGPARHAQHAQMQIVHEASASPLPSCFRPHSADALKQQAGSSAAALPLPGLVAMTPLARPMGHAQKHMGQGQPMGQGLPARRERSMEVQTAVHADGSLALELMRPMGQSSMTLGHPEHAGKGANAHLINHTGNRQGRASSSSPPHRAATPAPRMHLHSRSAPAWSLFTQGVARLRSALGGVAGPASCGQRSIIVIATCRADVAQIPQGVLEFFAHHKAWAKFPMDMNASVQTHVGGSVLQLWAPPLALLQESASRAAASLQVQAREAAACRLQAWMQQQEQARQQQQQMKLDPHTFLPAPQQGVAALLQPVEISMQHSDAIGAPGTVKATAADHSAAMRDIPRSMVVGMEHQVQGDAEAWRSAPAMDLNLAELEAGRKLLTQVRGMLYAQFSRAWPPSNRH